MGRNTYIAATTAYVEGKELDAMFDGLIKAVEVL